MNIPYYWVTNFGYSYNCLFVLNASWMISAVEKNC